MSVGKYCNREVVVVSRNESVETAINLMRQFHVGDVVVVDSMDERKPVGILTDRDIVIELLASDVDFNLVNIGDVMSYELATATEDVDLMDAVELMKAKGVRRLPITDREGNLVGLLTSDDVLEIVAEQMGSLVSVVSRQQNAELAHRP